MNPGQLRLQYLAQGERHVVFVGGELDLATVPELVTTIRELLAHATPRITLDLRGVTFMDSTGLHGLMTLRELCQERGSSLTLTGGQPQVQRLFEIAGLDQTLAFSELSTPDHEPSEDYQDYQVKRRRFARLQAQHEPEIALRPRPRARSMPS